MSLDDEGSTEVESEGVGGVDDEEEERQSTSVPRSRFQLDDESLVDVNVVETCEDLLSTECLSRTDGSNNFLSKVTAICDVLQGEPNEGVIEHRREWLTGKTYCL